MWENIDLLHVAGGSATKYGRNVAKTIYGNRLKEYVLTDDCKQSTNSKREPMNQEAVNLIKSKS